MRRRNHRTAKPHRSKQDEARGLTPRQLLFALGIASMNFNSLTAAAINAGYSAKSARKQASKLIRHPEIRDEIRRRMREWAPNGQVLNIYELAEW